MNSEWEDGDLSWEDEGDEDSGEFADDEMIAERLVELEPDEELASDELEAAEGGIPYRAPSDPAVLPSEDLEGVDVAAGFAPSMEETEPDAERFPERVERGDLEIQDHVCTMLRNNSETGNLTDIEVLVSRGIVLLRGSVPSEQDISIVDDIVSDLEGVRAVRNELRVEE